jgi:hypothetical protein
MTYVENETAIEGEVANQAPCRNTGIHHVGLHATNPVVSAEFYRDVRTRGGSGARGGSAGGTKRPRRCEATLGIAQQVTRIVRLGVSVATFGDLRELPKVADMLRNCCKTSSDLTRRVGTDL